ncbi:hypothetical protein TNCV_548221 [Trichonephila clavipes]|nr:hypothetical protein TNCV_548221 [Trichonephila clavipes]
MSGLKKNDEKNHLTMEGKKLVLLYAQFSETLQVIKLEDPRDIELPVSSDRLRLSNSDSRREVTIKKNNDREKSYTEGKKGEISADHFQNILSQNWGGNESKRTVTCMVLKAMANGRGTI